MDPQGFEVVPRVVLALQTIYDPNATQEDRQQAQNLCDAVKDMAGSPLWGNHLAHKDNAQPDVVRHFGLALLENAIRYRWNDGSYTDSERDQLRAFVMDLMTGGTLDMQTEKQYLKEGVARLCVEVGKRSWPLPWTDMDKTMRELHQHDPTHQELVLLFYRIFGEDLFVFDTVPADQKRNGLVESMMAIMLNPEALQAQNEDRGLAIDLTTATAAQTEFEAALRVLRVDPANEGWFLRWTRDVERHHDEWQRATETGDATDGNVAERLAVLTLNTLEVYLAWIMWKTIAASRVTRLLLGLLNSKSEPVRNAGTDCLLVLFSRPMSKEPELQISCICQPIFEENYIEALMLAWATVHGVPSLTGDRHPEQTKELHDEGYVFAKRLAQVAVELGERYIAQTDSPLPPSAAKERFFALLVIILDHPSMSISTMAASFWLSFSRIDGNGLASAIPSVLKVVADKCCKTAPPHIKDMTTGYADMDLEDRSEQLQFSEQSQLLRLLLQSLATSKQGQDMFYWIAGRIKRTLATPPNASFSDASGMQTSDSPYLAMLEGNLTMLACIIAGLPREGSGDSGTEGPSQALTSARLELVETVLTFEYADPILVEKQLRTVVMFAELMSASPQLVLRGVQKMFSFVAFTMPDEEDYMQRKIILRDETKALRMTAASSLVKLAAAMPDVLVQSYQEISSAVKSLIDRNLVFPSEGNLLAEFLLCIVFHSRTPPQEKHPYIIQLLQPALLEFDTMVQTSMTTSDAFFEASGLNYLRANSDALVQTPPREKQAMPSQPEQELRTKRAGILSTFGLVSKFLQRTVDPKNPRDPDVSRLWVDAVPELVRCVLVIVKRLQGLYDPTTWQGVLPEFSVLMTGADAVEGRAFKNELAAQVTAVARWMSMLRDGRCYHYCRISARMMGPLVANCPPEYYTAVLGPLFPPFLINVCTKLDAEWTNLAGRGFEADREADEKDETDEVRAERALRLLTRSFVDLLLAVFRAPVMFGAKKARKAATENAMTETTGDATPSFDVMVSTFVKPELVRFLFWDRTVAQPLLAAIVLMIKIRDTDSSAKIVLMLARMVPALVANPDLHAWLGRNALMAMLETLHDSYYVESHSATIGAITQLYLQLRPLSEVPYQTFAGLPDMASDRLQRYEADLTAAASGENDHKKKSNAMTKDFLKHITAVAVSQRGKKAQSFIVNITQKQILTRPVIRKNPNDGEDDAANEWFGDLFE
ncbi:hypothetical protein HKX48_005421 [Thoreauomyces humboldtii]|nr:hypothetical protein HKX48_005421 [Thoreauomyces humboldtii]